MRFGPLVVLDVFSPRTEVREHLDSVRRIYDEVAVQESTLVLSFRFELVRSYSRRLESLRLTDNYFSQIPTIVMRQK